MAAALTGNWRAAAAGCQWPGRCVTARLPVTVTPAHASVPAVASASRGSGRPAGARCGRRGGPPGLQGPIAAQAACSGAVRGGPGRPGSGWPELRRRPGLHRPGGRRPGGTRLAASDSVTHTAGVTRAVRIGPRRSAGRGAVTVNGGHCPGGGCGPAASGMPHCEPRRRHSMHRDQPARGSRAGPSPAETRTVPVTVTEAHRSWSGYSVQVAGKRPP